MTKQHCKQLEMSWRTGHEDTNKGTFKSALRRYHQKIREAKRRALSDCIDASTNSSEEIFLIIKDFTTPAATASNGTPYQELCNHLSDFFSSKITAVHDKFDLHPDPSNLVASLPITDRKHNLTTWNAITTDKISTIMKTIHSGVPSDPYTHHAFNKGSTPISLALPLNTSINIVTFPDACKHATVNALFEKPPADPDKLPNY